MLRLNLRQDLFGAGELNSNTTNVKVKPISVYSIIRYMINSNTTNVKVKQLVERLIYFSHVYSNTTNVKVKPKRLNFVNTYYASFKYNQC